MFVIQIPFLDLKQTYTSNQCLRWIKVSDDKFIILNGKEYTLVQQTKDRFCLICSEENFYKIWFDYFDLGYDYHNANYQISKMLGSKAYQSNGVRIIKPNMLESFISSYLCSVYNADDAKEMLESICTIAGERKKNSLSGIRFSWYTFPTIDSIIDNECYFDDENIVRICNDIKEGWFDYLNEYSYEEIKELLLNFDWCNKEMAEDICLRVCNMKQAFPIDRKDISFFKRCGINQKQINSFYQYRGLLSKYSKFFVKKYLHKKVK